MDLALQNKSSEGGIYIHAVVGMFYKDIVHTGKA